MTSNDNWTFRRAWDFFLLLMQGVQPPAHKTPWLFPDFFPNSIFSMPIIFIEIPCLEFPWPFPQCWTPYYINFYFFFFFFFFFFFLHKFLLVNQALSLGIAILYDKVNTWNTNHARATIPTVDFWREAGLIVGLRPANERRRYKVTSFLIGWAQT